MNMLVKLDQGLGILCKYQLSKIQFRWLRRLQDTMWHFTRLFNPGEKGCDKNWAYGLGLFNDLNTERSYKRQGHAPLKHFVGFLCYGGKPE